MAGREALVYKRVFADRRVNGRNSNICLTFVSTFSWGARVNRCSAVAAERKSSKRHFVSWRPSRPK